jgi:hypothetical protein
MMAPATWIRPWPRARAVHPAAQREPAPTASRILAELLHVMVLPDFERADAIASHPARWTGRECDSQHSQNRNLGARWST